MAVFVIAASPLAAQDAAPVAADVREPTADEKARIDDAWRSISYRIGTGYWTGVLEKLDEIQPLVAAL